jgi:hypothetical protein
VEAPTWLAWFRPPGPELICGASLSHLDVDSIPVELRAQLDVHLNAMRFGLEGIDEEFADDQAQIDI